MRKDLVRPEQPLLPDDDAYRFRHLLIRDTAYEALPKATRAELHERFADWLAVTRQRIWSSSTRSSATTSSRPTATARSSGRSTTRAAALAEQARNRLLAGGDHALDRGDVPAVVRLLSRALALLPPADPRAPAAKLELGTGASPSREISIAR